MFKFIKSKYLIYSVIIVTIIALFLALGPPSLLEYSSSPQFCGSCHVMDSMHEDWFLSGLHRNIKCVDCHLPNSNFISHYIWKGIDGMKDVLYFYGYIYSEPIMATSHGRDTIRENCIRCHGEMVSRLKIEDRNCWECHRRVNHRVTDFALK